MNYRYFLLNAIFLLGVSSLVFAMEEKQQKDYSPCNLIKQTDPNASPNEFLHLTAKIHEAKLDPCECIKYLRKQKKQKAYSKLKEELKPYGISEEQFNQIKEEIKVEKAKFRKKQNKGLIVECNPNVPKEICGMITDAFRKNGVQGNLFVKYLPSEGNLACIESRPKSFLKSFIFNDQFLKCNQQQKNAIIDHEQVHFVKEHALEQILLGRKLIEVLPALKKRKSHGLWRILRTNEAEADRLPAACFDCSAAEDMEILFKKLKQDHYQMIEDLVLNPLKDKKLKELRDTIVSDPHPIPQKRLDWAKRIKNLRVAHEEIKKNEKENSLKLKNKLNTLLTLNEK